MQPHLSLPPRHLQTCTVADRLHIWPWPQLASVTQAPGGPSSVSSRQQHGT